MCGGLHIVGHDRIRTGLDRPKRVRGGVPARGYRSSTITGLNAHNSDVPDGTSGICVNAVIAGPGPAGLKEALNFRSVAK